MKLRLVPTVAAWTVGGIKLARLEDDEDGEGPSTGPVIESSESGGDTEEVRNKQTCFT